MSETENKLIYLKLNIVRSQRTRHFLIEIKTSKQKNCNEMPTLGQDTHNSRRIEDQHRFVL